uniref:hypothetical protein n=1 Tax=Chryseobacterium sp. TaxID=1871047 RepID=UPI0025B7D303
IYTIYPQFRGIAIHILKLSLYVFLYIPSQSQVIPFNTIQLNTPIIFTEDKEIYYSIEGEKEKTSKKNELSNIYIVEGTLFKDTEKSTYAKITYVKKTSIKKQGSKKHKKAQHTQAKKTANPEKKEIIPQQRYIIENKEGLIYPAYNTKSAVAGTSSPHNNLGILTKLKFRIKFYSTTDNKTNYITQSYIVSYSLPNNIRPPPISLKK